MSCESVLRLIPLYYYGELPAEEEDALEQHLHSCASCAREMDRQRMLTLALDRRQAEVPAGLLDDCRTDLMAAIHGGAPRMAQSPAKGPWKLFLEALGATFGGAARYRQPIGALACIAIGFFAARFAITSPSPGAAGTAAPEDVFATVRSVQPDSQGRVQIAFDETRRRTVSGTPDNPNIQRLLLAAAHEENPAVRVESMGLLKDRAASNDVRDILLNALAHDPNAGVRLRALEGLKPLAGDPQVRKTLAQVLVSDDNSGVRMQAVDLLIAHRDDSMIGVMQDVVQKEDNNYIRLKLEKALKDMNASVGTF